MILIKTAKHKIEKVFNFTQIILLCLLPAALISGPFLADLFIIIVGAIYLFLCTKNNDWDDFKSYITVFFFIWCFYLIVLSLFSNNILLSLESSLFFFRFGVFSLAVSRLILNSNNNEIIKYLLISFCITFTILIIDAIFQYFSGYNFLQFEYQVDRFGRLKGLFNDKSILGSYLVRLLPIIFALLLFYQKISKRFLIFFTSLIILADLTIYLSGERVAFAYLILFTLSFIFLLNKLKFVRFSLLIIPLIFIIIVSVFDNKIKLRMIDYTIEQNINSTIYSPEHDLLYQHAFDIFLQNKLFGVGPKMFREECKLEKYNTFNQKEKIGINKGLCSSHPHNYLIQLLAETGIIGTIPYLILFILTLNNFIKQFYFLYFKKKSYLSDSTFCLLCGVMIGIWPLFPTGNIFNNWLNVILFLNIGLFFGFYKKKL